MTGNQALAGPQSCHSHPFSTAQRPRRVDGTGLLPGRRKLVRSHVAVGASACDRAAEGSPASGPGPQDRLERCGPPVPKTPLAPGLGVRTSAASRTDQELPAARPGSESGEGGMSPADPGSGRTRTRPAHPPERAPQPCHRRKAQARGSGTSLTGGQRGDHSPCPASLPRGLPASPAPQAAWARGSGWVHFQGSRARLGGWARLAGEMGPRPGSCSQATPGDALRVDGRSWDRRLADLGARRQRPGHSPQ